MSSPLSAMIVLLRLSASEARRRRSQNGSFMMTTVLPVAAIHRRIGLFDLRICGCDTHRLTQKTSAQNPSRRETGWVIVFRTLRLGARLRCTPLNVIERRILAMSNAAPAYRGVRMPTAVLVSNWPGFIRGGVVAADLKGRRPRTFPLGIRRTKHLSTD